MKFSIFFIFCLISPWAYGAEIRPALGSTAEQYLRSEIPATEVVQRTLAEKQKQGFNDQERLYLEDLTKKLPEGVRHELCPSFDKGLCEDPPHFKIWEEVPRLPEPLPVATTSSWLSRHGKWVAAALIGGFGLAAYSLRDKEIQINSGFR
ncbi:MAG: hypothetical protein KF789_10135 [Bdellovibrionaceae bacterium]|nr:hypothetical protein [Pseudobdellovibrionaceae bacterium]